MNTEKENIKQRAHDGDPEAQLAYGLSLPWIKGTFASVGVIGLDAPCEAQVWIQRSADQGHAPAQFILGKIYDAQGFGANAIGYYRLAADQGHNPAKVALEQKTKIIRYGCIDEPVRPLKPLPSVYRPQPIRRWSSK